MKYLKILSMLLLLLPIEMMAQFAWYGSNGKAQVKTGLGNGTNTEGIWFSFNDNADGGQSQIVFFSPCSADNLPNDAHVQKYGGIKCEMILAYGNSIYTRAGLGIPIVGETEPNVYEVGDASKWGGISIGYKSDKGISVELGQTPQEEAAMQYALPDYWLPASTDETFVRIPWSSFEQPNWGNGKKITGPEAAKQLVSIKFYISGREDTYNLLITKIGSYDMPETPSAATGITSPAVAIDENDGWYTISGVQLRNQPTVRGVYIHNGQKVVVK